MSRPFEPIQTADITWQEGLPHSTIFDESYYSKENSISEARQVFIEGNQLIQRWQLLAAEPSPHFVIAETGFAAGLNFLLSWSLWRQYASPSSRLHFISCEKYPLNRDDLLRCLALWPEFQELAEKLLDNYPILTPGFHLLQFDEGRVNLTLMLGDVLSCYRELLVCGDPIIEKELRESHVDAWFMDGFSPLKNPQMWSEQLFTTIAMLSKKNTTLATYNLADGVKQGLSASGFNISEQQKQAMMVAEFEPVPVGRTIRSTPWHVPTPKRVTCKRALVLGAGLAGCYTAYALARRGWVVTLIDANASAGRGASGNRHAILYPKLSSFYSPLNGFMLSSYLYAIRIYHDLLNKWPIGNLSGILQLAYNQKERLIQDNLQQWLAHYPELGTLVNAEHASTIAGIPLDAGGLFMPYSGWIDSPALCQRLIKMEGIQWEGETHVTSIVNDGRLWHVNEHQAEVLVIANGYRANEFDQTAHLPLKSIHGQMTSIMSNKSSSALKLPLCAQGHLIPAVDGIHDLGATYNSGRVVNACHVVDDVLNIEKLNALSTAIEWPDTVVGHWSGVRAAAPDYLPLVGRVAQAELFKQQFAGLISNSKRWIPLPGLFYDGLFICTGFGSRGLTTIPLSAEWLAATINNEPSSLSRAMVQSISPARFLRRSLIRPTTLPSS